jgi:hypothetical protein
LKKLAEILAKVKKILQVLQVVLQVTDQGDSRLGRLVSRGVTGIDRVTSTIDMFDRATGGTGIPTDGASKTAIDSLTAK